VAVAVDMVRIRNANAGNQARDNQALLAQLDH